MSIRVMDAIWKSEIKFEPSHLLVMLALADWCNDSGECYPAVESIAKKSRMSERNARYILKKLASDGYITITENRGRNNTNVYTLNLQSLHINLEKVQVETEKVQSETIKPAITIAPEPSLTVNKPSLPRQKSKPENQVYSIAQSISDVCNMDFNANKGRLLSEAKTLSNATPAPTPEIIREKFGRGGWYYRESKDWRIAKGQALRPNVIRELWGMWCKTSGTNGNGKPILRMG